MSVRRRRGAGSVVGIPAKRSAPPGIRAASRAESLSFFLFICHRGQRDEKKQRDAPELLGASLVEIVMPASLPGGMRACFAVCGPRAE